MIDITMTLKSDMTVYKNQLYRQPIIVSQLKDDLFQSKMTLDLHSGTHVDYPLHAIEGGRGPSTTRWMPIWGGVMLRTVAT